jgi:hypothetical protein
VSAVVLEVKMPVLPTVSCCVEQKGSEDQHTGSTPDGALQGKSGLPKHCLVAAVNAVSGFVLACMGEPRPSEKMACLLQEGRQVLQ